jgi:hypothetical protein
MTRRLPGAGALRVHQIAGASGWQAQRVAPSGWPRGTGCFNGSWLRATESQIGRSKAVQGPSRSITEGGALIGLPGWQLPANLCSERAASSPSMSVISSSEVGDADTESSI